MERRKQHVRNGEFTYICPECGKTRVIQFEKKVRNLKVKCSCGLERRLQLDYRRHFRKECNISGYLTIGGLKYSVNVTNISFKGYEVTFFNGTKIKIKKDDVAILEFTLPSKIPLSIKDEVIVRNYRHPRLGLEIFNLNPYSQAQKTKGFWLMPN